MFLNKHEDYNLKTNLFLFISNLFLFISNLVLFVSICYSFFVSVLQIFVTVFFFRFCSLQFFSFMFVFKF